MQAQSTQIRVTIPMQLQAHLKAQADKLGLKVSVYVRNLIINDVKSITDADYPVYLVSDRAKSSYQAAQKEEQKGDLVDTGDDVQVYLDNL